MSKARVAKKRPTTKATNEELASKAVTLCVGLDQLRRSLLLQDYAWNGMLKLAVSCKVPNDELAEFFEPMSDSMNETYHKASELSNLSATLPLRVGPPKPSARLRRWRKQQGRS